MMENMEYGRQRLKDIVEKEAREEEAKEQQQEKEDIDLTAHEHERALKGAYKSFVVPGAPKTDIDSYFDQTKPPHQGVNQGSAKRNGISRDNHDPMGKIKEACKVSY